ncbi:MAG: ComEC/Rec2 family competence protein, partial [Pseudomonadota bacterium]
MEQAIAGRKLPVTQARRWDWQRLWIAEIRRAILWVPVGLGLGIWLYFSLLDEPDPLWCLAVLPPLVMLLTGWAHRELWRLVVALALLSLTLGFSAALWQAHRVAAPVLPGPIDETVEGRVIAVDRSQSGSPRVLLDQVEIYGLGAARIPDRVRVTLRAEDTAPLPGQMMRVYARLSPLSGPLEPGGFDFRRQAFFKGLGAVGFARGIVVPLGTGPTSGFLDGAQIWLEHQRLALSRGLVERLPGPSGAFAAAIIVGDRSHIDESDAEALRAANLSHLLAISGLHMGILTGLIFVSVRIGLAALPMLSLYMSTKKLAAVAALLAGAAYLAVSGGTVATQRAFIMVAVALAAVQLDRPALTLRALAVAAVLILLIRPISLLEAGFQMSFAATTALVAGFEALRDARRARERDRRPQGLVARIFWALLLYGGGLVMTSLLAGLATAPFAAFHFNRMAPYGLP